MSTGKRGSADWIPGSFAEPTSLEMTYLARLASMIEKNAETLATHLREITNNERYQHHKGILKSRRREVTSLRQILDLIDEELQDALGEEVQS